MGSTVTKQVEWSWAVSRFKCRAERVPLPCCGGCPTHGLIDTTAHPRSSQGHLDSSNWPMWADQPTVHHSVWEDHFYSHHTPQHAFLFTIQNHRPRSGTGLLYEGTLLFVHKEEVIPSVAGSPWLLIKVWEQHHCVFKNMGRWLLIFAPSVLTPS